MLSREIKEWARQILTGKWITAVIVCLLADFVSSLSVVTDFIPYPDSLDRVMIAVSLLVGMLLSGVTSLGTAHYFTNLAAQRPAEIKNLFAYFRHLGKAVWMNMVMTCYIFLWSLLFVIPGIIAVYRYAMVPYLIAEFPDLSVGEAIEESSRLMKGNKLRLFCLQFSFIGWILLSVFLTCGIGLLFVMPYMQAADAAFYLEVTGRSGQRHHEPRQ